MLASGMSSAEELCLAVEGGARYNSLQCAGLCVVDHPSIDASCVCPGVDVDGAAVVSEPCSSVIAAGDGREVFTFDAGGKLAVAAGGKCVGVLDERVVMTDCAAAPKSELLGNGQLRLGDACVTQVGLAPGTAFSLHMICNIYRYQVALFCLTRQGKCCSYGRRAGQLYL